MPSADYSGWTKPESIAQLLFSWAEDGMKRPKNGSFAILKNFNGVTLPEFV